MLKRFLWRLFGALIGCIVGGAIAALSGDAIGKALAISNFEGGRGYFVAFVLLPLFALVGAIIGAVMVYQTWRFKIGLLAILLTCAALFVLINRDQFFDPPPQIEQLGNFELLTYTTESWGDRYALRYREEPFRIEGRAGMFGNDTATYEWINAVITFTVPSASVPLSQTAPAFIVNVGAPNNTSFFYLVHELNGQAVATHLSDTSGGNIAVDWIDRPPADPTAARALAVHRSRLEGGRWLLLGDNCVFDVQSLTAYPIDLYPLGDGVDASLNSAKLPIGFAPDQQSFVRLGSRNLYDEQSNEYVGSQAYLIVFDFVDNHSYTLPIDRARMRYNEVAAIDAAWLDHHFAWQPTAGAHERLVERTDFTPLPYRGTFTADYDGYREYNLIPVKAELLDELIHFLEMEFNAAVTTTNRNDPTYQSIELQIGDQIVHLAQHADGYSPPTIGLWMDRGVDSQLVETIGRRFDEALAGGRYDDFFLSDGIAQ